MVAWEFQLDTGNVSVEVRPKCLESRYFWVSCVYLAALEEVPAAALAGERRSPGGKDRCEGPSSEAAGCGKEAETGEVGPKWEMSANTEPRLGA